MRSTILNFYFLVTVLFFSVAKINAQQVPTPSHVVVVMLENHGFADIIGSANAPYINSLATDSFGALFTQSFGVTHPSQPNYMYIFSGDNQNVILDFTPISLLLPFSTVNLGASLLQNGRSFTGYSEDLPSVGFTGDNSGAYYRKHNPWVNWQGGTTNGIPSSSNQPFTAFPTNFNNLPTLSFVVPNQQHDMHDGTINQADVWLQQNLDSYAQWAKANNSLLIVTFDEDDGGTNNQIATIFIGQMVKHGQYNESIDHNDVLRTLEAMYSLPYAGGSANATTITDCWVYKPVSTLSALPTAICQNETVSFTNLSTHSPTHIAWNFAGGNPSNSTDSVPTITYNNGGTFDVQLISYNQMGADTLFFPNYITVHPTPVLTLSSDSVSLCIGDTAIVNASGALLYNWLPQTSLFYTGNGTMKANPTSDIVYEVVGASFGCASDTARVFIHVDTLLASSFSIFPNTDTTVCAGSVLNFNSNVVNGGNAPFYQWKVDGTNVGNNTSTFSAFGLSSNFSVSCNFTSSSTCAVPKNISSTLVDVTVSQLPVALATVVDSVLSSSPAAGYQWWLNGQPINGATSQTYIADTNGMYQVITYNADGCERHSNAVYVNLFPNGIEDLSASSFSLYPNPNSGQFVFSLKEKVTGICKIEMTDALGKIVFAKTLSAKNENENVAVNTSNLQKGVYSFSVLQNNKRETRKVIVE